jgi:endonuclease YncB( thermonuclease family)
VLALAAALAGCAQQPGEGERTSATVARIGDGDTLDLRDGARVRLVQVDSPEIGENECYGREARHELERLAPPGTQITLESDSGLDGTDRYGRLLRYVHKEALNVTVELVRLGAATPYFRAGEEGVYADDLLAAVEEARSARRGMWGSCRVEWDPDRAVTTRPR